MPQLDKITFTSQVFWIIIFFVMFYLLVVRLVIYKLFKIMKFRKAYFRNLFLGIRTLKNEYRLTYLLLKKRKKNLKKFNQQFFIFIEEYQQEMYNDYKEKNMYIEQLNIEFMKEIDPLFFNENIKK